MQEQISANFPCEIMFLKPFAPIKLNTGTSLAMTFDSIQSRKMPTNSLLDLKPTLVSIPVYC